MNIKKEFSNICKRWDECGYSVDFLPEILKSFGWSEISVHIGCFKRVFAKGKYIIKFDLLRFSNVDVDTLHRICREDVKSGLMTINEARDIIDFDESSEEIANKLLIQSNNTSTAEGVIAKEKFDTNQPIVNKNNNINNE